jgi:hypothetical protein
LGFGASVSRSGADRRDAPVRGNSLTLAVFALFLELMGFAVFGFASLLAPLIALIAVGGAINTLRRNRGTGARVRATVAVFVGLAVVASTLWLFVSFAISPPE